MKITRYVFLLCLLPAQIWANPWSISENAPVIEEKILTSIPHSHTSNWTQFISQRHDHGYSFYQKVLSPADGARCGMYPTCTDYGYRAIKKHGPILGGWMATDRLMRDHGNSEHFYTPIYKFGRMRLSDSIANNDFWFSKK
jgi:uncharacterized protein